MQSRLRFFWLFAITAVFAAGPSLSAWTLDTDQPVFRLHPKDAKPSKQRSHSPSQTSARVKQVLSRAIPGNDRPRPVRSVVRCRFSLPGSPLQSAFVRIAPSCPTPPLRC